MLEGYQIRKAQRGGYEVAKDGAVVYGPGTFVRCVAAYGDLTGDQLTAAQQMILFDKIEEGAAA